MGASKASTLAEDRGAERWTEIGSQSDADLKLVPLIPLDYLVTELVVIAATMVSKNDDITTRADDTRGL
jgi:hypothetical protein